MTRTQRTNPKQPDAPIPMARLLAMSYRLLIDELHLRLRERGWNDVRPSYGFVLLALRDRPSTTTELGAVLGVSKQAVSKLLDPMEASGYLERTTAAHDARMRTVALADRGRRLLDTVEQIYGELESDWAATIGPRALEQTRRSLTHVILDAHGGAIPAVRPTQDT